MTRRFVVAVDQPTAEQTKAIKSQFERHHAWWYWISGVWLVMDSSGQLTELVLRDQVQEAAPGINTLVLEVESGDWAGFGPDGTRSMFKWMRESWDHQRRKPRS